MQYSFGPFVLTPQQYVLEASCQVLDVQPKVFEVLSFLVAHRDRVVPRDEMFRALWSNTFVSEAALSRAISEARKVLGRGGGDPGWITTVYGRGFRFTGPVQETPGGLGGRYRQSDRDEVSIAVLPFADRGGQGDQAYFCEGIAEEVLNRLARLAELRVTARGVSFQFEPGADPLEVGRRLGVRFILAGTVRKDERGLRIGVELVDTTNGFRVWSEQWEREPDQILSLQEIIAAHVSDALEVRFAPVSLEELEGQRRPRSTQAYDHFLRGRSLFMEGRKKTYYEAREQFERAIELDRSYALAYAALADCCSYLYQVHEPTSANRESADRASGKALELAPDVAEAHASRAMAWCNHGSLDRAERHFQRALELDPRSYEANYHFARSCFSEGRFEEAAELFLHAVEAEPDAYAAYFIGAMVEVALGNEEKAAELREQGLLRVKKRLRRHPDDQRAIYLGAITYAVRGERKTALEWMKRAEALDPRDPVALYNLACVASLCDEVGLGLRYLRNAVEAGYPWAAWIQQDSELDALRSDPRFEDILASLKGRDQDSGTDS